MRKEGILRVENDRLKPRGCCSPELSAIRDGSFFQVRRLKTFDVASELIKYDFDRTELFADMYEVKRELLHLKGYMYQNFTMDAKWCCFRKVGQNDS